MMFEMFPHSRFWVICLFAAILLCYLSSIEHNTAESAAFMNFGELFEDHRKESKYHSNYVVTLEKQCEPGERDIGTHCQKEGCPPGMERGRDAGKLMCYPKCASGYESNGMSRCYENCQPGWETRLTQCVNQRHEFAKDVVPCNNCHVSPTVSDSLVREQIRDPTIGVITAHPQLVRTAMLDLQGGSILMNQPTIKSQLNIPMDPTNIYDQHFSSDANLLDGTAVNRLEEQFENAMSEGPTPRDGGAYRSDPTGSLPCPLGYSLSGDMCYENCPSDYRNVGDKCVRDQYIVERPSYDRGSGVPYVTRSPKFQTVNRCH